MSKFAVLLRKNGKKLFVNRFCCRVAQQNCFKASFFAKNTCENGSASQNYHQIIIKRTLIIKTLPDSRCFFEPIRSKSAFSASFSTTSTVLKDEKCPRKPLSCSKSKKNDCEDDKGEVEIECSSGKWEKKIEDQCEAKKETSEDCDVEKKPKKHGKSDDCCVEERHEEKGHEKHDKKCGNDEENVGLSSVNECRERKVQEKLKRKQKKAKRDRKKHGKHKRKHGKGGKKHGICGKSHEKPGKCHEKARKEDECYQKEDVICESEQKTKRSVKKMGKKRKTGQKPSGNVAFPDPCKPRPKRYRNPFAESGFFAFFTSLMKCGPKQCKILAGFLSAALLFLLATVLLLFYFTDWLPVSLNSFYTKSSDSGEKKKCKKECKKKKNIDAVAVVEEESEGEPNVVEKPVKKTAAPVDLGTECICKDDETK